MRRFFIASCVLAILGLSSSAIAQPRLAVELTLGQNVGIDPYIDNVVLLDGDVPILVDELPGSGVDIRLAFLFNNKFEISGAIHFYDRDTVIQHHRSIGPVSTTGRQRPDGSFDDSGVVYEAIPRTTVLSPSRNNGDLLFGQLSAGYRFYVLQRDFSLYFPIAGGLGFATVLEPAKPVAFGLQAETGIGGSYLVADPIGFVFNARIGGLITPVYGDISDAARTSFVNDESTLATVVSSFVQLSLNIGIQVTIR